MSKELTKLQFKLQKLEKKEKRISSATDFVAGLLCGGPACFIIDIPISILAGLPLITITFINDKKIENYKKRLITLLDSEISNELLPSQKIIELKNLKNELVLQLEKEGIQFETNTKRKK